MKKFFAVLLTMAILSTLFAGCGSESSQPSTAAPTEASAQPASGDAKEITIEYWQYAYESKVKLVDELIPEFEAANPGIKVVHKTFPYADYEQKLAAELAAAATTGEGPNIINMFYGWVPKYVKSGVLSSLPESFAKDIEENFTPMAQINKIEGEYYTIPTAVRATALFYNKTLLDEAGIAIEDIPTELMAWAQMASDLAKWNGDTLEVAGCTWQPDGQYHSWVRPVLMTQFGGTPLSVDGKTASWNSPECLEAFKFFIGLNTDLKVGVKNFYTDDVTAFSSGKAYFHVDGSYRLGTLRSSVSDFEWGVMELPAYNGNKGSFGSFWTNGITALTQSDPDKYDASLKFLEFLASEKVMERWTEEVGEIGARKSIADNETFQSDPTLKPFLSALEYATSYFYVDESADRQIMLDAIDEVVLNGKDPETALNEANTKVQALLDEFWLD